MDSKTMFATEGFVGYSDSQFYVKFSCSVPALTNGGPNEVIDETALFFSPHHIKRFNNVLASVIKEYEERFGTVCIDVDNGPAAK